MAGRDANTKPRSKAAADINALGWVLGGIGMLRDTKVKKKKGASIRKPGKDSLELPCTVSWTTAMPWQHDLLHPDVRRGGLGRDLEHTAVGVQAGSSNTGVLNITLFHDELSVSR